MSSTNKLQRCLVRIELCGGIASGKTTFASLMNDFDVEILFEDFKKNPFWQAFYANPGNYIFETEITFFLQHYHQIKKSMEAQNRLSVCDFSFLLDLAYAKIGLSGSRLQVFENIYSEIKEELGTPAFIVYLECNAETELERIRSRGRSEENMITLEFLDSLNTALEKEVKKYEDYTKILIINSSEKDFAHDESVKNEMRDLISDFIAANK